jgi:hypothetical protein
VPVWDFENVVHDENGVPVIGVCEHDPETPDQVMISLNSEVVADHAELERSTALHEFGHAVFDMPAAVKAERQYRLSLGGELPGRRVYRIITPGEEHLRSSRFIGGPMDWREFRANEFMGAFLAPADLLHRSLVRLANAAGFPTVFRSHLGKEGFPAIDCRKLDGADLQVVIDVLADEFGLSSEFIWVRLHKYQLLAGLR